MLLMAGISNCKIAKAALQLPSMPGEGGVPEPGHLGCAPREKSTLRVTRNMSALWGPGGHCYFFFCSYLDDQLSPQTDSVALPPSHTDKTPILWKLDSLDLSPDSVTYY